MNKIICLLLCGLLTGIIIEYSMPYPYKILRGNIKEFIFLSKEAWEELARGIVIGENECGIELSKYTQDNPPTDIIVGHALSGAGDEIFSKRLRTFLEKKEIDSTL